MLRRVLYCGSRQPSLETRQRLRGGLSPGPYGPRRRQCKRGAAGTAASASPRVPATSRRVSADTHRYGRPPSPQPPGPIGRPLCRQPGGAGWRGPARRVVRGRVSRAGLGATRAGKRRPLADCIVSGRRVPAGASAGKYKCPHSEELRVGPAGPSSSLEMTSHPPPAHCANLTCRSERSPSSGLEASAPPARSSAGGPRRLVAVGCEGGGSEV